MVNISRLLLTLFIILLKLLNINALYQFSNDISYNIKTRTLNLYPLQNGKTNGSLYNDNLDINIMFVMKNYQIKSYPFKINYNENLSFDNITIHDVAEKPNYILYNNEILSYQFWDYNFNEERLYIKNINHNAYIPFKLKLINKEIRN